MRAAIYIPARLNDLSVDVAVGAPAQGALFYRGALQWNALPAGGSGQVLTSGGAGADPFWAMLPASAAGDVTLTPAQGTRNVVQPSTDATPLSLRRFSSGAASDLQVWGTETGTALWTVTSAGFLRCNTPAVANRDTQQQFALTDGGGLQRLQLVYDTGASRLRMTSPGGVIADYEVTDAQARFNQHSATSPLVFQTGGGAIQFLPSSGGSAGVWLSAAATTGVLITGGPDCNRLAVRSATTQTTDLFVAQASNSGQLFAVTSAGDVTFSRLSSITFRQVAVITGSYAASTDASRQGRLTLSAVDFAATREAIRIEADGTNPRLGLLGAAAVARQTGASAAGIAAVSDANAKAALTALQSALAAYGLVTSPA